LLGVPVSLASFLFVGVVHEAERWVWETWPSSLGWETPPAWWALPPLALAGLLVGVLVDRLPGHGGHVPVAGIGGGPVEPRELPGALLAAAACLILGAVVGPEAPLVALGTGLALWAADRLKVADAPARQMIGVVGSAAAVAAIFGNPVVGAVLLLEVVALARQPLLTVMVPCLVASGVGGLVFTGLGRWTGIEVGALSIPGLPAPRSPDAGDLLWAVPVAAVVSLGAHAALRLGRWSASLVARRTVRTTSLAGVAVGACAAVYAWLVDRSPGEVAGSGRSTLAELAASPQEWSAGALVALLLCKGVAYGISLGAFRGGPVFPAILLGGAAGVLLAPLPGLGMVPALAIGMSAGTAAVLRLPVFSVLLVVLLLGDAAASQTPVVILSAVTALITADRMNGDRPGEGAHAGPAEG
jgi:H+/Cl- antiporter ClcA